MIYNYNKKLKDNAQSLRKHMTPEEKRLWYDFLKTLPFTVNRQKTIGNYIVDFFVASKRIVIELDGRQHGEEENYMDDEKRDADLNALGITILRYRNEDISTRFDFVCKDILKRLEMK